MISARAAGALCAVVLFALAAAAVFRSAPPAASPPQAPATTPSTAPTLRPAPALLRIGTWNIEWLGKPEKRSGPALGVAQDPSDIADYIVASNVAILALQEILPTSSTDRRHPKSRELDSVLTAIEQRTGEHWASFLFGPRGPARTPARSDDQLCAVIWNTRLATPVDAARRPLTADAVPSELLDDPSEARAWARPPRIVEFTAGPPEARRTDFALVVVHMKSDYGTGHAENQARRRNEAASLAKALPHWSGLLHEHDFIILGDTNMTARPPAREPAAGLIEQSLDGLIDTNTKAEPTHVSGSATDRIFIPAAQPEFADRRFEVWSDRYCEARHWDAREFNRCLSDHFMVVTTVKVMDDDD